MTFWTHAGGSSFRGGLRIIVTHIILVIMDFICRLEVLKLPEVLSQHEVSTEIKHLGRKYVFVVVEQCFIMKTITTETAVLS